jgi:hypothetical protein
MTHARNSFPEFFSTPFHIGIWNFACGFSELSYASSSRFVVMAPMVSELRFLGFITIGHMHVTVFRDFFFYTVSYRNPKLSMRFFWVKLHIEFAFHRRDPYGSGVTLPWIFYYRTYACNSFRGFFSTPFHIGTRNFPWGFSDLSYTSCLRFIVVTTMVPELHALGFFTVGHTHVTVSRGIFTGTWNFLWIFSVLSYTSSSRFIIVTPLVLELMPLDF